MIGFLEFHIALPQILLTTWADELLYSLSLSKLCSTCAKQMVVSLYTNEKILKTKIKSYEGKINIHFHNNKMSKKKVLIVLAYQCF